MTQTQKNRNQITTTQSAEARTVLQHVEVSRQAAAPKSALLQKDTEGKPLVMQVLDQPVHSPSSCSLHVTAEYPPAHVALTLQEELLIECHTNAGLDDLLKDGSSSSTSTINPVQY